MLLTLMHIRFLVVVANTRNSKYTNTNGLGGGDHINSFYSKFQFGTCSGKCNSYKSTGKITTSTPSKQASQSIRGAITDTGQFLHNVTEKAAGSKSARTIVNESSDVLGNAIVTTKKYFGSK